jgi:hypothetical protein
MRIFIGCSSSHLCGFEDVTTNGETKKKPKEINDNNINSGNSVAKYLCDELKKSGHKVEAWWSRETLRDGDDFFQKIYELSKNCDTGIFILNNELPISLDGLTYRYVTNSNVLLELGMFISQKGLSNVIFIADNNVNIPSDFASVNVVKYNLDDTNDKEKILKNVVGRLSSQRRYFPTNYINAVVHFNYDLVEKMLKHTNETQLWNSKSAYLGYNGAKAWADVELNPNYLPENFRYDFRKFLETPTIQDKLKNVRNIISLGCGIGTLDEQVLTMIPYKGSIKYIPVDINPYLAVQALHRGVRSIINVNETYAIVDDFESEISQLRDFIKNQIVRTEEESLYTLLGGTFCNIDNQHSFLVNWSEIIDSNDKLLIDAYVRNPKETDVSKWKELFDNDTKVNEKLDEDFKESAGYVQNDDLEKRIKSDDFIPAILHNAIISKALSSSEFSNKKKVKEYLKLEKKVRLKKIFDYVNVIIKDKTSNDSTLFIYKFKADDNYKDDNVTTLLKAKRHNLEKLINKIGTHFVVAEKHYTKVNKDVSRVYFLLTRKDKEENNKTGENNETEKK